MKLRNLEGAACYGQDPAYWDPDLHEHGKMAGWRACWMCDEAKDICIGCPVLLKCYEEAVETHESHMIRAASEWVNGQPRRRSSLRRNRKPVARA